MKTSLVVLAFLLALTACNKSATPPTATSAALPTAVPSKSPDAVQQKLQEYAGASATNCGRLEVHAPEAQSKTASDCAMHAAQSKHPFTIAYDMPGMIVGIAGDAEGKLFSVQSQGDGPSAALSTGACPSQLRVANSGRVTCFAPGDMGSMGGGHTAIPPKKN
jgi:predicted lipoprotein